MLVFESQSSSESEGTNVNLVLGRMYKASETRSVFVSLRTPDLIIPAVILHHTYNSVR